MKKILTLALVSLGLVGSQLASAHTISFAAAVGGAATGSIKETFNSATLGSTTQTFGALTVSFNPDGKFVSGNLNGKYAAPYLSGSNGAGFGNPAGQDTTNYLSTGVGSVTINSSINLQYIGLLWGSVDGYNTIKFYNGLTLVDSFTGLDINAAANGNQGVLGTYYVNFMSPTVFNKVVFTSSGYAFEFDNVAYSERSQVPDASATVGLFGLALLGLATLRRRK